MGPEEIWPARRPLRSLFAGLFVRQAKPKRMSLTVKHAESPCQARNAKILSALCYSEGEPCRGSIPTRNVPGWADSPGRRNWANAVSRNLPGGPPSSAGPAPKWALRRLRSPRTALFRSQRPKTDARRRGAAGIALRPPSAPQGLTGIGHSANTQGDGLAPAREGHDGRDDQAVRHGMMSERFDGACRIPE